MNLHMRRYKLSLRTITLISLFAASCSPTTPPPENQSPAADAGDDQTVTGGREVILDAGGSVDPDGDELLFSWTQTAGADVKLQNSNSQQTAFVAPNTNSALRFAVEVFDSTGLSGIDTVNVTVTAVANLPPIASAGFDRQVQGADFVLLDGTTSVDPEDGALGFSWIQISGSPVELFDAETSLASFVAPNDDTELRFQLTVTDEAELVDTDDLVITVTSVPAVLLVVNQLGNSVASYVELGLVDGNVQPDAVLSGTATGLDTPRDVTVTRAGSVIIADSGSNSLLRYLSTDAIDGDSAPLHVVQGSSTGLDQPASLAYSASFDVVFVLNIGAKTDILAFAGPSRVVFDGDLAPVITFPNSVLDSPSNIFLDGHDRLYVANTGADNILVFQQVAQGGPVVELARTITSSAFVSPVDVFVDSSDRLLVVEPDGRILLFNQASELDGNVEPNAEITVSGARFLTSIALDRSGTAFVTDVDANAIYVLEDLVTLDGVHAPNRSIVGSSTELERPVRLFVYEP